MWHRRQTLQTYSRNVCGWWCPWSKGFQTTRTKQTLFGEGQGNGGRRRWARATEGRAQDVFKFLLANVWGGRGLLACGRWFALRIRPTFVPERTHFRRAPCWKFKIVWYVFCNIRWYGQLISVYQARLLSFWAPLKRNMLKVSVLTYFWRRSKNRRLNVELQGESAKSIAWN